MKAVHHAVLVMAAALAVNGELLDQGGSGWMPPMQWNPYPVGQLWWCPVCRRWNLGINGMGWDQLGCLSPPVSALPEACWPVSARMLWIAKFEVIQVAGQVTPTRVNSPAP
ncbi:hypothetical protein B0T09DRAFT_22855 [Sordaria sp. MPI-SDFR-AT-0083]|nr:hypothetical protein B0T09DRAFT_22855 [Sordaria sp. MPI-SDFR-AT-0083]